MSIPNYKVGEGKKEESILSEAFKVEAEYFIACVRRQGGVARLE